jgi:uncharacterized protein
MSDRFVKDPMEVLKVGDVKEFRIISLDKVRKRIGLSLKSERRDSAAPPAGDRASTAARRDEPRPMAGAASAGNGGRRVIAVRGDRADGRGTDGRQGGGAPARPQPRPSQASGRPAQQPKEDDGLTYNPFAELLKNRKK